MIDRPPLLYGHCSRPVRRNGRNWIHTDGFYTCRVFGGYDYRGPIKMADPDAPPPAPEKEDY